MNYIKPRLARGMRDFFPEEITVRREIVKKFIDIFEKYGFSPIETPALEHMEILTGKYGEEERLIYRMEKRSDKKSAEDLGLRYDLTVPLARVIAMNPGIVFPFKRYQIQPCWRAERPQKGRFREFIQCDIDIIGSDSVMADCEIISVINDSLSSIDFNNFYIMINHRKILKGIADVAGISKERFTGLCTSIDKYDKIGFDGVEQELTKRNFLKEQSEKVLDIIKIEGNNKEKLELLQNLFKDSEDGTFGLEQTKTLFNYLENYGVPAGRLEFNLTLSRGLDYYTGSIFEAVVKEPKIGSIAGGGRYDNLVGNFSKREVPATGTSLGLERIFEVKFGEKLSELKGNAKIDVIVLNFTEGLIPKALELLGFLRSERLSADIYYNSKKKIGAQLSFAEKKDIPWAVILGPDEIKENKIVLKNLDKRDQKIVTIKDLIPYLKKMIRDDDR